LRARKRFSNGNLAAVVGKEKIREEGEIAEKIREVGEK